MFSSDTVLSFLKAYANVLSLLQTLVICCFQLQNLPKNRTLSVFLIVSLFKQFYTNVDFLMLTYYFPLILKVKFSKHNRSTKYHNETLLNMQVLPSSKIKAGILRTTSRSKKVLLVPSVDKLLKQIGLHTCFPNKESKWFLYVITRCHFCKFHTRFNFFLSVRQSPLNHRLVLWLNY